MFCIIILGGRSVKPPKSSGPLKQPPWRGNNPKPNHFYRYNYLDEDEIPTPTTTPNDKRHERLIKTLMHESSLKKTTLSSSTSALAAKDEHSLTREQSHMLNQSKLEDLISVNIDISCGFR